MQLSILQKIMKTLGIWLMMPSCISHSIDTLPIWSNIIIPYTLPVLRREYSLQRGLGGRRPFWRDSSCPLLCRDSNPAEWSVAHCQHFLRLWKVEIIIYYARRVTQSAVLAKNKKLNIFCRSETKLIMTTYLTLSAVKLNDSSGHLSAAAQSPA